MARDTDWTPLCQELGIDRPTPEYQILQIATVRIQTLRELVETENQDVIKTAHEVLPDAHLHFAHQAAWAMAAEINRLRAELGEVRK